MKSLITFAIVLLIAMPLQAQEKNISTYSVSIEDFINFVAEKYKSQKTGQGNDEIQSITFLIQVANNKLATEDLVILKQGFKLLSQRLNDNNTISILTYFGYNGIVMEHTAPSKLNTINIALNNPRERITEFHDDGIELAYNYVNENAIENVNNSIVIIRNKKASDPNVASLTVKEIKKIKRKKKKKDILKVAVSVLPEIIAILKN